MPMKRPKGSPCERVGAGKRRTEQNQETVEKALVLNDIARHHRSGTAPANSSFTKRCCTACDQPASLAARRGPVKRSGMTLVPVEPLDCQDSGSARAFHACARISADLAHKALAPFRVLVAREGDGSNPAPSGAESGLSRDGRAPQCSSRRTTVHNVAPSSLSRPSRATGGPSPKATGCR
jgi:hypothetical protein